MCLSTAVFQGHHLSRAGVGIYLERCSSASSPRLRHLQREKKIPLRYEDRGLFHCVSVVKNRIICFSTGRTSEDINTANHSMHVYKPTTALHWADPLSATHTTAYCARRVCAQPRLVFCAYSAGQAPCQDLVLSIPTSFFPSSLLLGVNLLKEKRCLGWKKLWWVSAVPCACAWQVVS